MSTKKERLDAICRIIRKEAIGNQEELLNKLNDSGFSVTQATLSRDIRQLKVAKVHTEDGNYVYRLTEETGPSRAGKPMETHPKIEFSHHLAVVRTRPGYAMGIASDIDSHQPEEILATIAGDDTILVIPRENIPREAIIRALERFV